MKIAILPVTPFQQNCTFLWDEGTARATVIDPGGDVERIMAELGRLQLKVDQIVLTHGHVDHAAGAMALQEELQVAQDGEAVPIVGPDQRDDFLLKDLARQGQSYGIAEARNCTPDQWLAEGDSVLMAGVPFDVLHCPGHTPGSIVLVNEAGRFAIVGDVLFRGSVGRTDFPYGSSDDLITAITNKLLPLGDDMSFLCGHGPGSTIGRERLENPFLQGGPA